MEFWNNKALKAPPTSTYRSDHYVDVEHLHNILEEAKLFYNDRHYLNAEAALLSRCIYRMKMKFRSSKDLKVLEKTNRALLNYMHIDISIALRKFLNLLPVRDSHEDVYMPTKNMLDYILVRLQGLGSLMCRVLQTSQISAEVLEARLSIGHFWKLAIILYALVSRIYVLSKNMLKYSCNLYVRLLPLHNKLKNPGRSWLPDDYKFPKNLEDWLGIDWGDLDKKVIEVDDEIDDDVIPLFDLSEFDDDDDDDVEFCSEYIEVPDDSFTCRNSIQKEVAKTRRGIDEFLKRNVTSLRGYLDSDIGEPIPLREQSVISLSESETVLKSDSEIEDSLSSKDGVIVLEDTVVDNREAKSNNIDRRESSTKIASEDSIILLDNILNKKISQTASKLTEIDNLANTVSRRLQTLGDSVVFLGDVLENLPLKQGKAETEKSSITSNYEPKNKASKTLPYTGSKERDVKVSELKNGESRKRTIKLHSTESSCNELGTKQENLCHVPDSDPVISTMWAKRARCIDSGDANKAQRNISPKKTSAFESSSSESTKMPRQSKKLARLHKSWTKETNNVNQVRQIISSKQSSHCSSFESAKSPKKKNKRKNRARLNKAELGGGKLGQNCVDGFEESQCNLTNPTKLKSKKRKISRSNSDTNQNNPIKRFKKDDSFSNETLSSREQNAYHQNKRNLEVLVKPVKVNKNKKRISHPLSIKNSNKNNSTVSLTPKKPKKKKKQAKIALIQNQCKSPNIVQMYNKSPNKKLGRASNIRDQNKGHPDPPSTTIAKKSKKTVKAKKGTKNNSPNQNKNRNRSYSDSPSTIVKQLKKKVKGKKNTSPNQDKLVFKTQTKLLNVQLQQQKASKKRQKARKSQGNASQKKNMLFSNTFVDTMDWAVPGTSGIKKEPSLRKKNIKSEWSNTSKIKKERSEANVTIKIEKMVKTEPREF